MGITYGEFDCGVGKGEIQVSIVFRGFFGFQGMGVNGSNYSVRFCGFNGFLDFLNLELVFDHCFSFRLFGSFNSSLRLNLRGLSKLVEDKK